MRFLRKLLVHDVGIMFLRSITARNGEVVRWAKDRCLFKHFKI